MNACIDPKLPAPDSECDLSLKPLSPSLRTPRSSELPVDPQLADLALPKPALPHFAHAHREPPVVVIDSFNQLSIDINGDGTADLSHGETIARLIEDSGLEVIRTQFPSGRKAISCTPKTFERLAEAIERGELKASAINVSLSYRYSFDQLNANSATGGITAENVADRKDEVLSSVGILKEYLTSLNDSIDRIQQAGVPVYVSAGNGTKTQINALGINATQVGAVHHFSIDPLKTFVSKPEYTADHSLVKRFEKGSFEMREVNGGVDINENGTPDVRISELTSTPDQVIGQRARNVVRPVPSEIVAVLANVQSENERHKIMESSLPSGLYSALELNKLLYGANDPAIQETDPARVYEVPHLASYRISPNGRIEDYYPPELSGTSFAAPTAIVKDLAKK